MDRFIEQGRFAYQLENKLTNVIEFKRTEKQVEPVKAVETKKEEVELSSLVVQTLGFYASQGWDSGEKARDALLAMQDHLIAQEELDKQ